MKLYNTLSRKIEEFEALKSGRVGIYTCGPTVYDYTHIGHLRKYINDDVLVRALRQKYEVRHVMNITDVGHLSSDADFGEDKLEKGAKKLGKDVLEVARMFEDDFVKSTKLVRIQKADITPRATEHVDDMIALIETLIEKGFTYETSQAIYFEVSKFDDYTKLSGQDLDEKITGARHDVVIDNQKRNPADFALWFFTRGRFENHSLSWESPWGEGFPGWHIECSAMSMKYLGLTLDIHTGGVDHIPVHHTNEIAQSEAATGQKFANYWVHSAHLMVDGEKMSKSLNNFYRISDLVARGVNPLAFRYLTLQTHYRSEMNFTWEAVAAAQSALMSIYEAASEFEEVHKNCDVDWEREFEDAVHQDLNMPKALSILHDMMRSKIEPRVKAATLYKMDEILGLDIAENAKSMTKIPREIQKMVAEREALRKQKKFTQADHARQRIEKLGYIVEDQGKKTKVLRKL